MAKFVNSYKTTSYKNCSQCCFNNCFVSSCSYGMWSVFTILYAKNMSSADSQFELALRDLQEAFDESFIGESEKFGEIKNQKLIMALYGSVNSGKSTTINALTGRKLADVKAIAGYTEEIQLYRFSKNVYIADTPGLEDINEEKSKLTQKFIERDTDIILFFFNGGVGASKSTVDAYKGLQALGKPIIAVLNKIDSLKLDAQKEMEQDIKDKTGAKLVPISARDNIGIDVLHRSIVEILEFQGNDLFFFKVSKFKEEQVDKWIKDAADDAMSLATIPIPGVDLMPLTRLQVGLVMKVAFIYECQVKKKDVMQLFAATVTGSTGRQIYRWGIQGLKAVGWLGGLLGVGVVMNVAAKTAGSVTYGFGHVCKAYYKSGMTLDLDVAGEIFGNMAKQYQSQAPSILNRLWKWWLK